MSAQPEPEVILQNPMEAPPPPSDDHPHNDPPDFSLLRLHSSPPPSSSSLRPRPRHCSSCSCSCSPRHHNPRKRPSPSSSLPAKKLFLDPAPAPAPVPLPRLASDPVPLRSALPPLPPPLLRRTISEPLAPAPPKSISRTSSTASEENDKTPNSKTSKMLSRWREINLWVEDFIQSESENLSATTGVSSEDQDNNDGSENFEIDAEKEEDCAAEIEESLNVERDGERLHIHFKCHCGKAYQFLLADGNCFYKLM